MAPYLCYDRNSSRATKRFGIHLGFGAVPGAAELEGLTQANRREFAMDGEVEAAVRRFDR
jgi:hypothetical protein